MKVGRGRLFRAGDAAVRAAVVVAACTILIEQLRALRLGIRAEQSQRTADGDPLRRFGKLLDPLGLSFDLVLQAVEREAASLLGGMLVSTGVEWLA